MPRTLTRAQKVAALAALAAGDFAMGKVVLFTAVPNYEDTLVLADCTLADFTGYAASSAIVWAGEVEDQGELVLIGGSKVFVCTAVSDNQIVAWGIVDTAGTLLLYVEAFAAPIPIAAPLDSVLVVPRVPYGS